MKWEEGVVYKISPKSKKNIEHIQFYEKDDLKIKYVEAYRTGWVTVLGDEMSYYFDADEYDPEIGVDVWMFPTEGHEFIDGVSDDITFPKTLSEADRDQLESIYYEEGTDGLENMGWEQVDSELLFFGKLNIDKA
jgi:hypothetical protein|tara:strand:+ start:1411 stop:1815 length:405 start_codon:yes stop_codon:yes gene_type:complete